jgi:hypothetical protein
MGTSISGFRRSISNVICRRMRRRSICQPPQHRTRWIVMCVLGLTLTWAMESPMADIVQAGSTFDLGLGDVFFPTATSSIGYFDSIGADIERHSWARRFLPPHSAGRRSWGCLQPAREFAIGRG